MHDETATADARDSDPKATPGPISPTPEQQARWREEARAQRRRGEVLHIAAMIASTAWRNFSAADIVSAAEEIQAVVAKRCPHPDEVD